MSDKNNSNWVERSDGWHRDPNSHQQGNAGYYDRPIPPVRDESRHPIKSGGGTDWNQVEREIRERRHGS